LEIEAEMIVQFFIAPTEARLERFQSNQPVYRDVRSLRVIDVEHRKGIFVDAAEEIAIEVLCP
jgi:hypothetical protein